MTATVERPPSAAAPVHSGPVSSAAAVPSGAVPRPTGRLALLLRAARATPVAIVLAVVVLAATLATALAGLGLPQLGASPLPTLAGEWWRLPAALVIAPAPAWLPLLIPLLLLSVGYAERRLGSRAAAAAYVGTGLAGVLLGSAAQLALSAVPRFLPGVDVTQLVLDPTGAVSGTLIAASFASGPLWRRRIRVVVIAAALLAVLHGGGAADLYRFTAALSGFVVGGVLAHRYRPRRRRSSHREVRSLLATVVALTAAGPLIAITTHSRIGPLAPLAAALAQGFPPPADTCFGGSPAQGCAQAVLLARLDDAGPVVLALMPLVALLVAAAGLRRGRRSALLLAVCVNLSLGAFACAFYVVLPLTGSGFFPGFSGYDEARVMSAIVSAVLPLAMALLLLGFRREFPVQTPRETVRRYLVFLGASVVLLCALYVGGGALLADGWTPRATVGALLADLPERFVPPGYVFTDVAEFLPTSWETRLLFHWIGPALWLSSLAGALPLFLGSSRVPECEPSVRLRRLLHEQGGSSIGHMGTWPDTLHWVSESGDAAVPYRLVSGVALTVGGPICAPDRRPDAVAGFARHCYEHGWLPCFYSLREEDYAETFAALAWATVRVGEEMVLDPRVTTFSGRAFQVIRTSVNGAKRLGIEARWLRYRDLGIQESLQVREISEQWVAEKGLPEMGFTLGGLDELEDPEVRLLVAVDAAGTVHGFTSWLPRYRSGDVVGWTLDVMRRRADGYPRVMEFLIATAVARLGQEGIEEVSLAAAPLASSSPTATAGVLDVLARSLEPAYGFRSLFAFKSKFQPACLPLIVATPDALTLPVVARAVLRAYLPETSAGSRLRMLTGLLRRPHAAAPSAMRRGDATPVDA